MTVFKMLTSVRGQHYCSFFNQFYSSDLLSFSSQLAPLFKKKEGVGMGGVSPPIKKI
jgi:hypothetical protein